ncbi:MAG: TatD family hydrolase [Verrucomicrobiota bacterium]
MLCDAHNHLHDARLDGLKRGGVLAELMRFGLHHSVVNGTSPADWGAVATLAEAFPRVIIPSFGVHPWKAAEVEDGYADELQRHLDAAKGPVGVGEIGLDRWIEEPDVARQEAVFRAQLQIAAERNLPVTIHCLRAWGPLMEVLQNAPLPERGFLIHSVGASPEMIEQLAKLGAYFSVSGPFADPKKKKFQRALRAIPEDRLLIETDAPDMLGPPEYRLAQVRDPRTGEELCHPFNLLANYVFVREFLALSDEALISSVHANFTRFFLDD